MQKNPSPGVTWTPGNAQSRHVSWEWHTNRGGISFCILPYLSIGDFSWLNVYHSLPRSHVYSASDGITHKVIDGHLTWKDHTNDICSRAINAKAFLQWNFHRCPPSVKSNCYYIHSEAYTWICCYNMVPTSPIPDSSNWEGSTQCRSLCYKWVFLR